MYAGYDGNLKADPPPQGLRFGAFELTYPEHIPRRLFDPLRHLRGKDKVADRNVEMWDDGSVHVMGQGSPLVTDQEFIEFERAQAKEAEAQDAAGEGHPDARICYALRVDFLVALTFELALWKLSTREVQSYLRLSSLNLEFMCSMTII